MGWIADTLKALLGFDDEQIAYRDALASAERYVQWGCSHYSVRDLEHAIRLLATCSTENAPNAHYVYRHHRTLAEANVNLVRYAVTSLGLEVMKIDNHFKSIEDGRLGMLSQIEALRQKVADLEAEGSLISAREERRRLEEMERDARELPNLDGERTVRNAKALSELLPRFEKHRAGATSNLTALRELQGLNPEDHEVCTQLTAHMSDTLAKLEADWKRLHDELKADAPQQKPQKGLNSSHV